MKLRNILLTSVAAGALLAVGACTGDDDNLRPELTAAEEEAAAAKKTAAEAEAAKEKAEEEAAAEKKRADELEAEKTKEDERKAAEERLAAARTANALYLGLSSEDALFGDDASDKPAITADTLVATIGDANDATTLKKTGMPVSSISGWAGTQYKLTQKSGPTDTAVVFTNQGAPTREPFAKKYLTELGEDNQISTGFNPMLVASSAFATGSGGASHPIPDGQSLVTLRGTYDGAPGSYTCSGDCSSAVGGGGIILTGSWHFTPDAGAMASTPDANYLAFGWWLRQTDAGYSVEAFTDEVGTLPTSTSIGGLQGSATYNGAAAGKYALSSPLGGIADAGHFTASAMLKADWGNETLGGTITGMINGFMGADGTARDWTVELQESNIDASAATFGLDADGAVWTVGEVSEAKAGGYTGQFYETAVASDTTTTGIGVPLGTSGTFDAEYGNIGAMSGAFGATRE